MVESAAGRHLPVSLRAMFRFMMLVRKVRIAQVLHGGTVRCTLLLPAVLIHHLELLPA